MSGKPRSIPIPWTPEQDQALRDIWPTTHRVKEHLSLFGDHTYAAIIMRAYVLGLGKRPHCPRAAAICWTLIKRELEKGPANRYRIAERLGIHPATTYKEITAKHAAKLVHIVDWERRTKTSALIPVYALGTGIDKPKPANLTNAQHCRRHRVRANERRIAEGVSVRGVNPFSTVLGAAAVPTTGAGRVYRHLVDTDMEAA